MKISVDSKSFVNAISWVVKTLDSKDPRAFVSFEVNEDGEGFLSHANSFSYMKSPFTVTSESENQTFLLNGQYLQRLQNALNLSQDDLTIHTDDKKFIVKSKSGRFTVPTVSSRTPAKHDVTVIGEVSDADFFDTLQRLSKLCDSVNEEALPAVGSVDVKLTNDTVTLMATDRWALSEIKLDFTAMDDVEECSAFNSNLLIPYENASLITPTKGSMDLVEIVYVEDTHQFGYRFVDGREALFSLKDAQPIPYAKVIAHRDKVTNQAIANVSDLTKALSIMNGLAWDETSSHWNLTENGLTIYDSGKSNKLEVSLDDIEIDEENTIVFDREVIMESFAPISTKKVLIKWKDAKTPIVLTPILDDGETLDGTDDGPVFVLAITQS